VIIPMSKINEKIGVGSMLATGVGIGVGAAMGAPLAGAAAGYGAYVLGKRAAGKVVKKAMSGPPKKPKKPKTTPKRKVGSMMEGIVSFKDYVDEIDFGFTEEEFEVTGDEVYEDWGEVDELQEAEKGGRQVKLGKPFLTPGGPKKRSVYVKHPSTGNVVKVNFGDPNMTIKKDIPARRKSFRARHNCENPGPRNKARYWSCRQW
jgi:hypothetical protein